MNKQKKTKKLGLLVGPYDTEHVAFSRALETAAVLSLAHRWITSRTVDQAAIRTTGSDETSAGQRCSSVVMK